MSDIEIRFRNDQVYLLKKHCMTSALFESQIKEYDYTSFYQKYKIIGNDTNVEHTHFPAVNIVFYKSIFTDSCVPSPQDFLRRYFDYYATEIQVTDNEITYCNQRFDKSAVESRLLRTYPSLIRDFDFYLLLVESKVFDQVIYSCMLDIQGKDIIIKRGEKEWYISLFVDTSRSNYFKKIKDMFRHKNTTKEIRIPLHLETARTVGDFMLYSKNDVQLVDEKTR